MANTFFVVLPSNVSDYPDNKPNKYRVHLPKPIEFKGGNWVCGLYSIQYPQSWAATIGTDVKQWIEINYKNKKPHRIGIPKTTQLTPNGLSFFLKLVLSNKEKSRKRRDVSIETFEDEIIIDPEINLYPHNYWEAIRDYEQELEQHKVKVEEKTKEVLNEEDETKKEELQQELDHLHSLSEGKKKEIRLLTEEANKRDRRDDRLIANQFLEQHPNDYHEQVIKMEINIIVRYIELEEKIKESREKDGKNARSGDEIQRFINSIKRMRKNLEAIESVIIEKDLNITRDEFNQQNSNTHSEFVQKFFDDHPSEEIIPTKEIFEEQKDEQGNDDLINKKTVTLIKEKESQAKDLHSDIEFEYLDSIDRFRVIFNDPEISNIIISSQLCYVLGFPMGQLVNGQIGKYGIDLKGGFTSFAVYSKGLTSNVIMGNSVSSLLRIVAVENRSGGVVERVYDQPMFIPVLPREINEIEIELRWMNGNLVKFDHGTVIITLMFNRMLRF
uniref:Uncharacterized protein n=1 Tax=Meloidogyne enterolobii TaxID=390850 RepID=A0A6V7UNS9_MELEN|nr:unnamed protein product [Meloidogyne enterolobii]